MPAKTVANDHQCFRDRAADDDDHVLREYGACGGDRQDAARKVLVPI